MNILFLSRWFPYPPNNGSKLRIYNLLRGLARRHRVTLLTFAERSELPVDSLALEDICEEVYIIPRKPFNPYSTRARLGFFSLNPRSVVDSFSQEMKEKIERLLAVRYYDLVIASQIDMAVYSKYFKHLPAIFEEVEVGLLYEKYIYATSTWYRLRSRLTWIKHRRYLLSLLKNFRVCTVVSDHERYLLSQAVNGYGPIEIIPNCIDLASYNNINQNPQPGTLIFTGSFSYYPNYEAMSWFVGNVFPEIQNQIPDAHLYITGNHMNRYLPPVNNVTLTGFVDDVRSLIRRSWCSVVPLHSGGGTRLKILEAMALKTPVVSTSKGAEGLDVKADKHLLIADTPKDFANAVIRLLKEPQLRQELAHNAYQLIGKHYDWQIVMPQFLDLVDKTVNKAQEPIVN